MGCLSAAEVVDVVYAPVVINGAKSVRNGVCGTLASKSDGTETEGEGSVKIKHVLPAVTKKTVICRINGNSTAGTLEFDSRRSLSCKGNGPLAMMRLTKIGGTREREVKRLGEEGVFGNPVVNGGACGEAKVQNNTSFRFIFWDCLKR